jgi:succinoglycan biosynthesis transport protein ExoP
MNFFEQQTKEANLHLEAAERKLREFAKDRQVVAAGAQRDLALQRMSELDSTYRRARVEVAETQERVSALQAKIAALPERSITQVRTADNPELLKSLKASLLDLQLKRTQLLTKFEPSHRLVREVEEEITQAQSAITAESLTPVRDETTDKNTHYEWAKSELEREEIELRGLQARTRQIAAEEASYRSMSRKLGEDAISQDDLESSERAARENYLLYVKKQEEARMADALDQQGIANVAIAEEPVAPALPVWSTWTVLCVGMVAASATGVVAAFVADYVDPVFRDPEDVMACLQIPVLASLPEKLPRRQMA